MRWLMVLGGFVVLMTAAVWWVNRPPAIKSPIASTDSGSKFGREPVGDVADPETRNNGLWQQKWAERNRLENRLMATQRRLSILRQETSRADDGAASDSDGSAKEAELAMTSEIEWIELRIAVIDATELRMAKQGLLVPEPTYKPLK